MKTLKYLKRAKISFAVFVICGFLSTLAFFLQNREMDDHWLHIGLLCMYGWMVNPFPMYYSIMGIRQYLFERKDTDVREIIGKRWMLFPAIMLGSLIVFWIAGGLMVRWTGGV